MNTKKTGHSKNLLKISSNLTFKRQIQKPGLTNHNKKINVHLTLMVVKKRAFDT